MATAGMPPRATPSTKRRATRDSNVGMSPTSTPSTVAALTAATIVRRRPHRSETRDHGITPTARPMVAEETASADCAASTWRSSARMGSTPCTEYSCANVATPAHSSATRIRRYPELPFS